MESSVGEDGSAQAVGADAATAAVPAADFSAVPVEKMLETVLDPSLTTVFRLDGVQFSSFVRAAGCARPFDPHFTSWMTSTFETLMTSFRFHAGFCGSDEMSLVWYGVKERHFCTSPSGARYASASASATSEGVPMPCPEKRKPADPATFVMPYSGRVLKLCSVLAGKASAAFAAALMEGTDPEDLLHLMHLMPAFDCRVWQVPTPADALQGLHVRQVYVLKNARMMYAQHYLSHKALQGVSSKAAAQLVAEKFGADHAFEAKVPEAVRVGTYGFWVPTVVEGRDGPLVRDKLHLVVHFGALSAAAAVE